MVSRATTDQELERLYAHRLEALLDLGFETEDAIHLAEREDLDHHELERLILQGCAPDLALQIVL